MDTSPSTNSDAKTWAMFCHLAALAGYIVPFGNLIGPLVIWQIKKSEIPLVDDQGKEALNFQITVTIVGIVGFILAILTAGLLFPVLFLVGIAALVFIILAALAANKGERYRYPFAIRLIK